MDPNFPLTWHFKKDLAGGGPLFDLSSHAIDLARYLIGEVKAVTAVNKTFIEERPLPGQRAATFSAGGEVNSEKGKVEVAISLALLPGYLDDFSPAWPRNVLVGANSPSLCPTISSVI